MACRFLVALSVCTVAASTLGGCVQNKAPTSPQPYIPADFSFYTQESPNQLFLESHFSLLGIGRIPGLDLGPPRTIIRTEGKAFPPAELERHVKVFQTGENIVIYGHVIAATGIQAACFKAGEEGYTKITYWGPEAFSNEYLTPDPGVIIVGYMPPDFLLPTYLKLTPGNYRMKIFAGDRLVAVFPFEVVD